MEQVPIDGPWSDPAAIPTQKDYILQTSPILEAEYVIDHAIREKCYAQIASVLKENPEALRLHHFTLAAKLSPATGISELVRNIVQESIKYQGGHNQGLTDELNVMQLIAEEWTTWGGVDQDGKNVLNLTIENGDEEATVMFLLIPGINIGDFKGEDPSLLIMAIKNQRLKVVQRLLQLDANPSAREVDNPRFTPLMYACLTGNLDLVRLLLDGGASFIEELDCFERYDDQGTLSYAVKGGNDEIVLELLKRPSLRSKLASANFIWYHIAKEVASGKLKKETMETLLGSVGDVNEDLCGKEHWWATWLEFAARFNNVDLTNILLRKGADVNKYSRYSCKRVPLTWAAESRRGQDVFRILLDEDANIDTGDAETLAAVADRAIELEYAKIVGSAKRDSLVNTSTERPIIREDHSASRSLCGWLKAGIRSVISSVSESQPEVRSGHLAEQPPRELLLRKVDVLVQRRDRDRPPLETFVKNALTADWLSKRGYYQNQAVKDEALINACQTGNYPLVRMLVGLRANVRETYAYNKSCLDHTKRSDIGRFLISSGAGWTGWSLNHAVDNLLGGDLELLRELLCGKHGEKKFRPKSNSRDMCQVFHGLSYGIRCRREDVIRFFLDLLHSGGTTHPKDERYQRWQSYLQRTLLYDLDEYYNVKILKMLLKDRRFVEVMGNVPLAWCVFANGDMNFAKELYNQSRSPHSLISHPHDDVTPLQAAVARGHTDMVEWLLECGVEVAGSSQLTVSRRLKKPPSMNNVQQIQTRMRDTMGNPEGLSQGTSEETSSNTLEAASVEIPLKGMLEAAVKSNLRPELIQLLINHGAKIPVDTASMSIDEFIFTKAVLYDNIGVARHILEICKGIPPISLPEGIPPLHYACKENNARMAALLLEHGAGVNEQYCEKPPLLFAISQKNTAIATILLNHGADKNGTNCTPPLHDAISMNDDYMVALLLDYGADINQPHGLPPLHYAIKKGLSIITNLLLKRGAIVSQQDGMSPLHYAVENHELWTAECLLDHGADVNALYGEGKRTPLHLAARKAAELTLPWTYETMVTLLLDCGADPNIKDKDGRRALDYFEPGKREKNDIAKLIMKRMGLKEAAEHGTADMEEFDVDMTVAD